MTEPNARAHVEVGATADEVYALVSDLPGMSEMAEEYSGGRWLAPATGPAVGARFVGSNRRGFRVWRTVSTVTDAEPTRFAFDVRALGLSVARWQYDIEPTDTGCRVTESTWDRRPAWMRPLSVLATGVRDRSAENQRNIESTLARLKVAAEGLRHVD
ncbi:hypothetical protein F4560_002521 [Saccharothrix ecbatanensis]|uniref:Polyketide cyclase/dehydrase/lipid transport protein n=1 Tax=Saccharothrix ecbatanensis TaxID=1105145 RepID=A0A7W9M0G7_9PSEU|nr:SRPBCC family protein [Saccharothrix ecbatanensis]MBB5802753.1 hypothetical protein [Saccharothrix ecbatanensis]